MKINSIAITKNGQFIAILLIILSVCVSFILSEDTSCPTCTCRHYIWMGLTLIGSGILNVLLVFIIGIILFKVCVLTKERFEDTDIDRKTARRLPNTMAFNFNEQVFEEYGVPQKILGVNAYEHRIALMKAYRLLWNQALHGVGTTIDNEVLDFVEKLLTLGVAEVSSNEPYILQTTQHVYEKENKKLKNAIEVIKAYNIAGKPLAPIIHVVQLLYDSLYRISHNRSEDILQERILIGDNDPMLVVKPEFQTYFYPNIMRVCSIPEITTFFKNLIESTASEEVKAEIKALAEQSDLEILPSIIDQIQIPVKKPIEEVNLEETTQEQSAAEVKEGDDATDVVIEDQESKSQPDIEKVEIENPTEAEVSISVSQVQQLKDNESPVDDKKIVVQTTDSESANTIEVNEVEEYQIE